MNCCDYVREAYEAKKWAFVSDYARLKVLVDNGGIYMDTDVEVIKPLDMFLDKEAFAGADHKYAVSTGTLACTKNFALFAEMLNEYQNKHFCLLGGGHDLTTNVATITDFVSRYGFIPNNTLQTIRGFTIYPQEYFCPKNYNTLKITITNNTYAIHYFSASWTSPIVKARRVVKQLLGSRINSLIFKIVNFLKAKQKH